jgi:hypothetical protein
VSGHAPGMTDVLAKLPIAKGVITAAEFEQKLLDEVRSTSGFGSENVVVLLEQRRQLQVSTQVAFHGELMAKY